MRLLAEHFLRDERSHIVEHGLVTTLVAMVTIVALFLDPLGIKPSLIAAFHRATHALEAR